MMASTLAAIYPAFVDNSVDPDIDLVRRNPTRRTTED
jgi:hypothetical protein